MLAHYVYRRGVSAYLAALLVLAQWSISEGEFLSIVSQHCSTKLNALIGHGIGSLPLGAGVPRLVANQSWRSLPLQNSNSSLRSTIVCTVIIFSTCPSRIYRPNTNTDHARPPTGLPPLRGSFAAFFPNGHAHPDRRSYSGQGTPCGFSATRL